MSAHILITRVLCCRMAAALLCYWLCSASLSHPCLCGVTLDLRLGFRPRRASRTTANRCKGRTGSPTRSSRWARRFLPWCLPEKVCPGVWGEPAERRGLCNGVRASVTLHSLLWMHCLLFNNTGKPFLSNYKAPVPWWGFVRVVESKYLKNNKFDRHVTLHAKHANHILYGFYLNAFTALCVLISVKITRMLFWNMMVYSSSLLCVIVLWLRCTSKEQFTQKRKLSH